MPGSDSERVLVLAPTSADSVLSRTLLSEAHVDNHICRDLADLAREFEAGAGAILVTEEVFAATDVHCLLDALQHQPPWSDVPVVFLSGSGSDTAGAAWAMELLGNVTVLERPARLTTLISSLRTAIRARRRQYQLRDQILDLQQADASLRSQSQRQLLLGEAAAVLLSTDDPDTMMRGMFKTIAPHFELDMYVNYMVNDSGDALHLQSHSGLPDQAVRQVTRLEFGEGASGRAALQRQAIVVTRMQDSDDPGVQIVRALGVRAYAVHPLIAKGRLLGTLAFASKQRDEFEQDELRFLQTICHYVTVAYERVRLIHELREGDHRKDEFLATLAHELRNPLAPIRNSLHIMRLADSNEAAREQARQMMERQLGQMVRLIDDLLDVSRITRGKLDLRKERVELAAIVNTAVETTRPLIEAAGHALTITLPPHPIYLDADPMRLAQVFSNLLNNAAKYTERGGRIWLTATPQDHNIVVSVRDNGIGIPQEALPTIFDMFAQVDRSLEKAQGGLGIGLTLVRRLVELHGGSVEARSEGVGQGSEFIARLPVATTSRPTARHGTEEARRANGPACRILVADDNRDAAESMSTLLRLMGNEVRTVHDGVQAMEEASVFRPDVMLLDIGMPRLNGYDVARSIREQRWGADMVLVALTGWGAEEDRKRAIDAGFDQHFTKPVNPGALERLILDIHDNRRVARRT